MRSEVGRLRGIMEAATGFEPVYEGWRALPWLAPLATCPGDTEFATEGWYPAGPIAYVQIQSAGVARGSMNWPDKEGCLLTTLDFENWSSQRRTNIALESPGDLRGAETPRRRCGVTVAG
ncbi:MAG: hypothetical protein ACYSU0_22500, partial [Planctomycetota bacterium]